jgi:hypothetical protein
MLPRNPTKYRRVSNGLTDTSVCRAYPMGITILRLGLRERPFFRRNNAKRYAHLPQSLAHFSAEAAD